MIQFRKFYTVASIVLLISASFHPSKAEAKPSPGIAGGLSLVPGLGQISNGDTLEGVAWMATILGGVFALNLNSYNKTALTDLWMYNIYDAYRDAGAHSAAKNSLLENWVSAFNPLNFWGPYSTVPLVYQAAMIAPSGHSDMAIGPNNKLSTPFYMSFIALGEEGLFRGFVFPGLTDVFGGSAVVGATTSSLSFAAFHALYVGQSSYAFQPNIFLMRTALGLFYCWQTYHDKFDLRKSIFSHTWFDVLVEWDRQGMPGGGQAPQLTGFAIKTQIPF